MNDDWLAFKNRRFFPSLNGLRAICAVAVIKEHTDFRLPLPRLFEMGFLGVDMFFVISGFLIVTLLLREREGSGRIDLRSFYLRRTLRIFPIYYLLIGLFIATAVLSYPHSPKTWDLFKWSFPVFLLYLQDLIIIPMGLLFHTWSLAMEEQFYLVWPSIEKFARRWLWAILGLGLAICQVSNFGLLDGVIDAVYRSPEGHERPIFLATFTPILLGVAAAHAMNDAAIGPRLFKVFRGYWVPLLIFVLALGACQLGTPLQGSLRASLHVLFCLLILSLIVNPKNVFSAFLNWKPVAYLGTISYGIYLYHTFILAALLRLADMRHFSPDKWLIFLATSIITIGVAAVSFRYFEKPVMGMRQHPPMVPTSPSPT